MALSPEQFGLTVGEMPESIAGYARSGVESVEPQSLIATQDWLRSKPSLSKVTPPGVRNPPQVYEVPTGARYIGDGHHRIAAHAAAGKEVRVEIWKRTKDAT